MYFEIQLQKAINKQERCLKKQKKQNIEYRKKAEQTSLVGLFLLVASFLIFSRKTQ